MGKVCQLLLTGTLIDTRHIKVVLIAKELVDKIGLTDTSSAINSHELRPRRLVNLLQQSYLTLSSYNSIKSTHTCKLYILLGANIQLFLGKHKQNAKVYYANAFF